MLTETEKLNIKQQIKELEQLHKEQTLAITITQIQNRLKIEKKIKQLKQKLISQQFSN